MIDRFYFDGGVELVDIKGQLFKLVEIVVHQNVVTAKIMAPNHANGHLDRAGLKESHGVPVVRETVYRLDLHIDGAALHRQLVCR